MSDELVRMVHTEIGLTAAPALVSVSVTPAAAGVLNAWTAGQRLRAFHEGAHLVVASCVEPKVRVKSVDLKGRHGARVELGEDDDDRLEFRTARSIEAELTCLLAGLEAERLLGAGEVTDGSWADLKMATELALHRMEAGLDPESPMVSVAGMDYQLIGPALQSLALRSVTAALAAARERAREIVSARADVILEVAGRVFVARRLSDDALIAMLRTVGLDPAPLGS